MPYFDENVVNALGSRSGQRGSIMGQRLRNHELGWCVSVAVHAALSRASFSLPDQRTMGRLAFLSKLSPSVSSRSSHVSPSTQKPPRVLLRSLPQPMPEGRRHPIRKSQRINGRSRSWSGVRLEPQALVRLVGQWWRTARQDPNSLHCSKARQPSIRRWAPLVQQPRRVPSLPRCSMLTQPGCSAGSISRL